MNYDQICADSSANTTVVPNLPESAVCSTNPSCRPLAETYRKARNRLRRLDAVLAGLEAGSRESVAVTLKSAVYFTIATIANPKAAQALEGWNDIDVIDRYERQYLHPMKYLFRECTASSLKSKISFWSAIAKDVHTRNLPESAFLDVLKKHGGIDRWYRSLPKDGSKGGRPKADKPKPGSVEELREKRARGETESCPKSVFLEFRDSVLEPLKAKDRQVVLVAFDVTQSAAGFAALVKRLRVLDEFAGALPVNGISDEDWRNEMGVAADEAADPEVTETTETETHDIKEAA